MTLVELHQSVRILHGMGIKSIREARIYCAVAAQSEPTQALIADQLRMLPSTTNETVSSMVKRGLLKYEPHPDDRRMKILRVAA